MTYREMVTPIPEIPSLYLQKGNGDFWHIGRGKLTCASSNRYREAASEFFSQYPKVLQIEDVPSIFAHASDNESRSILVSLALLGTDGYELISPQIVKVHDIYHIDPRIFGNSKILEALLIGANIPSIDVRTAFEYPVLLKHVLRSLLLEEVLKPRRLKESEQKTIELLVELTTDTEKLNAFFRSYDISRYIH